MIIRIVNHVAVLVWLMASLTTPPLYAAPPEIPHSHKLTIISPADGTVVFPGDTVPVKVTVASGVTMDFVGLGVVDVGLFSPISTSPYVFQVPIPANLIGPKKVTALGKTSDGTGISSYPITIDIETSAVPSTLGVSPHKLFFQYVGQQLPLVVTGVFPDVGPLDLTNSSKITYRSEDTGVATVSSAGIVTATGVGPTGTTAIIVTYGGHSVGVPVSVKGAVRGDLKVNADQLESNRQIIKQLAERLWGRPVSRSRPTKQRNAAGSAARRR